MTPKKRYKKVFRLKRQGLTFAAIGRKMGLTRQRVWQMYMRIVDPPTGIQNDSLLEIENYIDGYVYLIGSMSLMWFKVGMTSKVEHRISTIKAHLPFKIDIQKSFFTKKCRIEEKKLHLKLKSFRMRGEWFSLPQDEFDKLIRYFEEKQ